MPAALPSSSRAHTVEALREQIKKLEAAPRPSTFLLPTGIEALDALLGGGLPMGTVVELWGQAASGRVTVALRALARATQEERLGAYVDCPGQLYGPFAESLGVRLSSLLWVRPKTAKEGAWAALQLVRSGAFAVTVLDVTETGHRFSLGEAKLLQDAAAKSAGLLLVLSTPREQVEARVRVGLTAEGLHGLRAEVLRGRVGHPRAHVPWEALFPQAPAWRYRAPHASSTLSDPQGPETLARSGGRGPPRPQRDPGGAGGLAETAPRFNGVRGQRPGRDVAMPLLTRSKLGG
jgi:hypothetical protein